MSEQIVIVKTEPVKDSNLHKDCVLLGGVTPWRYSIMTGESTDHLLVEFIRREVFSKYAKN